MLGTLLEATGATDRLSRKIQGADADYRKTLEQIRDLVKQGCDEYRHLSRLGPLQLEADLTESHESRITEYIIDAYENDRRPTVEEMLAIATLPGDETAKLFGLVGKKLNKCKDWADQSKAQAMTELLKEIKKTVELLQKGNNEPQQSINRSLTSTAEIVDPDLFPGREEYLKKIKAKIENGSVCSRLQITGMGGLGKTKVLRLLYADYLSNREQSIVETVAFLRYDGNMDVTILGITLPGKATAIHDMEQRWQRLRNFTQEHKTLLLIDDVSPSALSKPSARESDESFKKLFTLNADMVFACRKLQKGFEEMRTPPLPLKALLNIYKQIRGRKDVPTKDGEPLKRIFKERAGSNTLIVQRLGAIAHTYGFGAAELERHLSKKNFVITFNEGDDKHLQEKIDELYSIEDLSVSEINILSAFSLFPAQPLKIEDCIEWMKGDARLNEKDFRSTLSSLKDSTWLENPEPFSYSIHQLVSTAVLDQQPISIDAHSGLVSACTNAISYDVGETFIKATPYISIAQNIASSFKEYVLSHGEIRIESFLNMSSLFAWIGHYFTETAVYQAALEWAEKALAINEDMFGCEHPDTAVSYNNLAFLYEKMGDYAEALLLHEKALGIRERILGKEHLDTATSYNNLALLYEKMGDYAEVLSLCKKALGIRECVLGKEHPDTSASYNNLAFLYEKMGDYAEALLLHEKALGICERILGEEHPDTAISYGNLAGLYQGMGEYEKALPLYEKALGVCERVLGEEHPDTAISYNNLALLYESMGDYAEALLLHEKALGICERVLGEEHPNTAISYNNLALLYESMGKYVKALSLYKKALMIGEKLLGEEHPTTKIFRENFNGIIMLISAKEDAEGLCDSAKPNAE
jgi:tetratricopeptide (TPR) repeat protein